MRRKERDQSMRVGDSDWNTVTDASNVNQRWKENFEWLINVDLEGEQN